MNSIWKKLVNRFVNYYQSFAKEKAMEEIRNGVLLLAQHLDLETDTEDTDQPVQNLAEELATGDLMEVEAQKNCRGARDRKTANRSNRIKKNLQKIKSKKKENYPFYIMKACRGSGGIAPVVLILCTTLR